MTSNSEAAPDFRRTRSWLALDHAHVASCWASTRKGYLRTSTLVSISDCSTVLTDDAGGNAAGGGVYNDESGSILFEGGVQIEGINLWVRGVRTDANIESPWGWECCDCPLVRGSMEGRRNMIQLVFLGEGSKILRPADGNTCSNSLPTQIGTSLTSRTIWRALLRESAMGLLGWATWRNTT